MKIFSRVQSIVFVGMLIFAPLSYSQGGSGTGGIAYQFAPESKKSVLSQRVEYKEFTEHGQVEQMSYSPVWGLLGFGVFFFSLYFVMKREEFEPIP